MKSLKKMICAALSLIALLSTIIMAAGCDDTVWNRLNAPPDSLLLLGLRLHQDQYLVTVTTTGISGIWSGLQINIDGQAFALSSITPTFLYSTSSEVISNVSVSQSPNSYSCSVTSFTPVYAWYILNIAVQCNPL